MRWFKKGLNIVSGVGGLVSGIVGFSGNREAGREAQKASDRNAQMLEEQARLVDEDALENASRLRMNQSSAVSGELAAIGTRNVARDGSALDGAHTTSARYEQEISDMLVDAKRQQSAIRSGADMERWEGTQFRKAQNAKGIGSLLSGGITAATGITSFFRK